MSLDGARRQSLDFEGLGSLYHLFGLHPAVLRSLAVVGRKILKEFLETRGIALGEVCERPVAKILGEKGVGFPCL